jgi:hypothetical protein
MSRNHNAASPVKESASSRCVCGWLFVFADDLQFGFQAVVGVGVTAGANTFKNGLVQLPGGSSVHVEVLPLMPRAAPG